MHLTVLPLFSLPFPCQPISDASPYVEQKNGLYAFNIQQYNLIMIFLKDKSAPRRTPKKKKTKATKVNLSLNDGSDSDSTFDLEESEDLLAELTALFGDEARAQEAHTALLAGGDIAKAYKKIIRGLQEMEDISARMDDL